MEYTGGDISGHDLEVDDCRWFPIDDAIKKVEYKDEMEILKKAKEMKVPIHNINAEKFLEKISGKNNNKINKQEEKKE